MIVQAQLLFFYDSAAQTDTEAKATQICGVPPLIKRELGPRQCATASHHHPIIDLKYQQMS